MAETFTHKISKSILLPIRLANGTISVYLQKRSLDMALPGLFGLWGGGAEGSETPEQTLLREIKEELNFDLDMNTVKFFNRYEFINSIKHVYLFEAPPGWEQHLTVGEGEYGQWFTTEEALARTDFILEDKVAVNDLERKLLDKPIR